MSDSQSDLLRDEPLATLMHDIHGCLFVLRMGLETLKGARADEQQFAEIRGLMEQDGLKRLESLVEELAEIARQMQ